MKTRLADIQYGCGDCHAASVVTHPSEEAFSPCAKGLRGLGLPAQLLDCPTLSPVLGDAGETWSHAESNIGRGV